MAWLLDVGAYADGKVLASLLNQEHATDDHMCLVS